MLEAAAANLEVRRQDIEADPPPAEAFDVVHTRLLLMHLARRDQVLAALVTSLRPGGFLLIEESDPFSALQNQNSDIRRMWESIIAMSRSSGMGLEWARGVPAALQRLGLVEVGADLEAPYANAGSAPNLAWKSGFKLFLERLNTQGQLTATEAERAMAILDDPNAWIFGPGILAAWGRRPLHGAHGL